MSVSESMLKENKIKFVCVGNLYETSLEIKEDVEIQIKDNKTARCKQITGKVAVDTGSGIVVLFPQFNELGYDGKENMRWSMANAMFDWNPRIKGDNSQPVTRVMLEGSLNYYDGYVKDSNKVELKKSYRVERASTTIPDNLPDGFSFEGNFYIHSTDRDTDTGIGIIRAYYSKNKGEIVPVEFTVDDIDCDIVFNGGRDFEPIEAEQTRQLTISYYKTPDTSNAIEEVQTQRFGGGRKASPNVPTHTRYKEEFVLTSASKAPMPKPEEGAESTWYNPVAVDKAIKARAQKIEEMENNPPEKKTGGNSSLRQAKANAKTTNKFGTKPRQAIVEDYLLDEDDDDLPF